MIYLKDAFENAQILAQAGRKSDPLRPLFRLPSPKPTEGSVSFYRRPLFSSPHRPSCTGVSAFGRRKHAGYPCGRCSGPGRCGPGRYPQSGRSRRALLTRPRRRRPARSHGMARRARLQRGRHRIGDVVRTDETDAHWTSEAAPLEMLPVGARKTRDRLVVSEPRDGHELCFRLACTAIEVQTKQPETFQNWRAATAA